MYRRLRWRCPVDAWGGDDLLGLLEQTRPFAVHRYVIATITTLRGAVDCVAFDPLEDLT